MRKFDGRKVLAWAAALSVLAGSATAPAGISIETPARMAADWLSRPEGQATAHRILEVLDARIAQDAPLLLEGVPRFEQTASADCRETRSDEPNVYKLLVAPSYDHPTLKHVIGPANDADLMIATLRKRGISEKTIRPLVGPVGRAEVVAAMEKVVACVRRNDQVVFYFSGHAEWFDRTSYSKFVKRHLAEVLAASANSLCGLIAQGAAAITEGASPSSGAPAPPRPGSSDNPAKAPADCAEPASAVLAPELLKRHANGDVAMAASWSFGTILAFTDGPFEDRPLDQGLKSAGMRGRDISAFVTAVRNRGADAFVVIDTHHAAGLEIGARQARALVRWRASTLPRTGVLTVEAEDEGSKLKFNAGEFAGFYVSGAAGGAWEMQPEGVNITYGALTYALAQALQAEERPTVRQLAESISHRIVQKDLLGRRLGSEGAPAERAENLPIYEASNPELAFLAPRRPLTSGEEMIEVLQPKQMRGHVPIATPRVDIVGRIKDRRREDIVLVEVGDTNVATTLDHNLQFRSTVDVTPGKNQVRISVLTRDGIFSRRDLAFTFEGDLEALLGEGERYALVIGNRNYDRSKGYDPLVTPHADARSVADVLQRRHGFTTKLPLGDGRSFDLLLLDAKGRDIDDALALLGQRLTPKDVLVIYYAGHGVYDEKFGLTAWVPVDAQVGRPTTLYPGTYLQGHIKGMAAHKVIVLSDSCYAGRLLREGTAEEVTAGDRRQALVKAMSKKSRVFIAAGGNEPVLDGGGSGHSVFTRALLEGLEEMTNGETFFSARELFDKYIYPRVHGREHQEPRYSPLDDSGHLGGDFVFGRK